MFGPTTGLPGIDGVNGDGVGGVTGTFDCLAVGVGGIIRSAKDGPTKYYANALYIY